MNTAQASLTHDEPASWRLRFKAAFGLRPRRRLFDARDFSDHLKRDLGFLDGNDPSGRRR